VDDVGAEHPQHAGGARQHVGVATHEREQRALAGGVVAAAQRRVQQPAAVVRRDPVQPAHLLRIDRGAHQDVALAPDGPQPPVGEQDVGDHPAPGGDQDDVADAQRVHVRDPADGRGGAGPRVGVVPEDVVARGGEVPGHRTTHAAQAQDPDRPGGAPLVPGSRHGHLRVRDVVV
jgi:hypothetical protein